MQISSPPRKPLNIYDWDNVLCNTIKLYCSLINELWGERAEAQLSAGCLQDASLWEFVCLAREDM